MDWAVSDIDAGSGSGFGPGPVVAGANTEDVHLEALLERVVLEKQAGNSQEIVPNKIKQAVGRSVCKIELPEDSWATGFFCLITIAENQSYYGLCTNNHVIDFQYIRSGSDVKCISDDGQIVYMNVGNYSFTSKLLDATFLELSLAQRAEVSSKGFSYLQIEEDLQIGQTILVGQHPRGQDLAIETGTFLEYTDDGVGFYHSANTDYGSSGGPVTNASGRAIGIHRGGHWKKSVARNIGVLISQVLQEMTRDAARTDAVREVKMQRNASIFLPSIKMRPVAPPAPQPEANGPRDHHSTNASVGSTSPPVPTVSFQIPSPAPAPVQKPDRVPIFLLPKGGAAEKIVRPAKSAPLLKKGEELVAAVVGQGQQLVPTPDAITTKTVRNVCNSVCNIKLPNGASGCGFLIGVDIDNVMHYGLITTSHLIHSTYIQTYSILRCKFGFKVVYVQLSAEYYKIHLRHVLFIEINPEDREKMAKDITFLQTKPHFAANEVLFVAQRDEPSSLVPVTGVTDVDDAHFTFSTPENILTGAPLVNVTGLLVGVTQQRRADNQYIAVKLLDIYDTILDERRRFYNKQQRKKRKDAAAGEPKAPRGKAHPLASLNEVYQNVDDILTRTVCRVEAKSGSAMGFFCSFYNAGVWHFGLFTSERVIHSRYLQNNSYVRCTIGNEDVCIPTGNYSFCCPMLGVTFIDVSTSYKKSKKRESPLRRIPFLTVNFKDYESLLLLQRLHQKESPPVIEANLSEFRGVHFGYTASHKCRLAGAPICDPFGFVLGLQIGRSTKGGLLLAAQMRYVCEAIAMDRQQNVSNYPRVLLPLKPWKIDKMKDHGLHKCTETIFVLRNAHDGEPIAWFRRTVHGWFWSPLDPLNRKIKDDAIWMRINKTEGLNIIGGKMNGKDAPAEVKTIIAFVREHGEYYL